MLLHMVHHVELLETYKMKKKYIKDFFIYKKNHHYFIIPTIIVYYNKHQFLETGIYTPSWGLTIRWMTFMIGLQIQESY